MTNKPQQFYYYVTGLVFLGVFLVATTPIVMATETTTPPVIKNNYIEAGLGHHDLTNSYQNWDNYYLKGVWHQDESNIWDWAVENQDRFGDTGVYLLAGLTHIFNEDWFGSIHLGTSKSGFFLPRQRIDAFINRKLLPEKNLILTFGTGYIDEKDVHTANSLYAGASYYFDSPWMISAGVRWNNSSPGSVSSTRQIISASWIRNKDRYITLNVDWGREAYQLVGGSVSLVDFSSDIVTLTWREWLNHDWGSNVVLERYSNPFYDRNGITIGIFKEF
ncbi:MAG: YaiO family outer membrane beta-barrel protein [Gammaproteobacteria bacterium]|nr:YaiO family outer membrane beta-barrel protein [Gammaproteobacteria bacterium]